MSMQIKGDWSEAWKAVSGEIAVSCVGLDAVLGSEARDVV